MPYDKPTLSWSSISQYTRCPRQYWHQRIARTKPGKRNARGFEGTCGHAAVEFYFREKRDRKEPSVEKVIEYFNDYWLAALIVEDEMDWPDGSPQFRRRELQKSVGNYVREIGLRVQPMEIEKFFRVRLPECSHDVIGYIDLLATDMSIHDHKFVNKMPSQSKIDDAADWNYGGYGAQLTCYALARAEAAFGRVDNWQDIPLYLNVAVKGGDARALETHRTLREIIWFRQTLVDIARAITAQVYYPNPANCGFCDFRYVCRDGV